MHRKTIPLAIALIAALVFPTAAAAQTTDEQVVIRPAKRQAPPWLGVSLKKPINSDGVEVSQIMRRSPADGTGIREGDVIVRVGKRTVNSVNDIRAVVRAYKAGEKIEVVVKRGDAEETLVFTLSEMPDREQIVRNHLVGRPAPELYFKYVGDGKDTHLTELKGKPTIIDFWATWCGPCHRVQEDLAAVKDEFGDEINIVGVSEESASVVRRHLAKFPARYAMAVDVRGASHAEFAIHSIPTIVILDSEHRVASVVFGAGKRDLIAKKVRNLVGTKPNDSTEE